jgi:hypothetical protein
MPAREVSAGCGGPEKNADKSVSASAVLLSMPYGKVLPLFFTASKHNSLLRFKSPPMSAMNFGPKATC